MHHTGYPIGALLSGVVASPVLATFGEGSWRYCFLLALLVAIPLMIFWAKYSTADRINTLYQHIDSQGLTRPATQESSHVAKGEGMKTFTHPAQPQYFADGGQYPADANRLYGH